MKKTHQLKMSHKKYMDREMANKHMKKNIQQQ